MTALKTIANRLKPWKGSQQRCLILLVTFEAHAPTCSSDEVAHHGWHWPSLFRARILRRKIGWGEQLVLPAQRERWALTGYAEICEMLP
jgi:hypothetical protein